ncbi:hypothetical protein DBR06_SOUSAS4710020, partial [Sousa chinensis]
MFLLNEQSMAVHCRTVEKVTKGDGVLDLSTKKTSIKSEESSICDPSSENSMAGRLHRNREDYVERSAEFADGLLSKALKDIQSGALDINKAGILYGIPQKTLLLHLEALPAGKPASFKNKTRDFNDSYSYKDSKETCAVLQKVALWARAQAERTEKSKLNLLETSELKFPTASSYLHQLTLQKMVTQFKEKNESLQYETHPTVQLKIPQLRVSSVSKPQPDGPGLLDVMYQVSKTSPVLEGSALQKLKNILPKQNKIECSGPVTHSSVDSYFLHGDLSPLCLNSKNGTVDGTSENTEDGLDRKDNKQPRKKRGRYRQYDHEIMEEAIAMVMSGKMSVSKAQGIYGVPHSTLEYKVKERSGTLKTPPKKKLRLPDTGSTVDAKSEEATKMEKGKSALSKVLESLCIHHQQQVLAMLKFLVQEQNAASLCCCNTSYSVSSESQNPLIEDDVDGLSCSCEYRLAERGYLHNERQSPGFVPLPVCIKDIHCLSCQTVTIEHIKTVVNRGIANSYNSHRCCSGLLPNIHSTKSAFQTPLSSREIRDVSISLKDVCRSRSPSPPPLSPVQTEGFEKLKDVISELSALENNRLETNINQPPSLTPAEVSSDKDDHEGKMHKTKKSSNSDCLLLEDSNNCTTNQEKGETTVIFQDLMDRINEKLKSIETIDMTNLIKLSSSDCNRDNDLKLRDLITSLLHNAKASDYSFMELLSQHDKKVENKIIQTRFRKRQETLLAMRNSPDSPIFRRQSLQIKRELASLDENFVRKKYTEKNPRKFVCHDELFSADKEEFYHCQGPPLQNSKNLQGNNHAETFSPDYGLQSLQLPLNLEANLAFDAFPESFKTTSEKRSIRRSQEKSVAGKNFLQNHKENPKLENIQTPLKSDVPGLLSRTKRNIVPPGWYSIYVTNNYIFKKSPKAKKVCDSTKKKDPVKNIQIESSHNIDLNKIAMNSNLQVVVERLEDTINMAKKSWNNQSLSEGYKASKKLIEIDDKDQHAGRNMTLTVSRMTCKEQSLSKPIVASTNIKSNYIPTIDLNNKRLDNQKNSSVLNTEQENILEKNLPEVKYDHQCTVDTRHTEADEFKNGSKSMVATIPLRHSIRDRKPSLHFLHPLASSGSLIYRNALLHKSCKLHLQKGKSQKDKHKQSRIKIASKGTPGARNSRNAKKRLEDKLIPISEVSLDPIISSNPLLRWWAASTSNDSLLEELNNRFEQITNAWVPVSGDEAENCVHKKREHIENDNFKIASPLDTCFLELEVSPVKMLFRKKYDLNELCTWFMQTTETQSLSLVRKANARNPLEVINTRGIKLGTKYSDFNTSPFRKHFKKFALSSPSKSAGKLHILHKVVSSPLLNVKSNLTLTRLKRTEFKRLRHERWRREGKLHSHGTGAWISKRRNLRFFCQNQFLSKTEGGTNADIPRQGKNTVDNQFILPPKVRDDFLQQRVAMSDFKTHGSLENKFKSEAKENGTNCSQKDFEKGPRLGNVCPNNWRSKTLKGCRIFLRKINYLEHRNTFKLNTIIYSPESVNSGSNHQTHIEESKHITLRSHSARQNSFKKQSKEIENAKANSPSSNKFPSQLDNSKLNKCVNYDKNPSDSSEVLSKLNKRKRPPWKTTEMSTKRHKRQSCNSGQMANYYSKSQLG